MSGENEAIINPLEVAYHEAGLILPEKMDTKIRSFIISDHGGAHHGKETKSPQFGVQIGSNPAA